MYILRNLRRAKTSKRVSELPRRIGEAPKATCGKNKQVSRLGSEGFKTTRMCAMKVENKKVALIVIDVHESFRARPY
jgi:hypothetical protein